MSYPRLRRHPRTPSVGLGVLSLGLATFVAFVLIPGTRLATLPVADRIEQAIGSKLGIVIERERLARVAGVASDDRAPAVSRRSRGKREARTSTAAAGGADVVGAAPEVAGWLGLDAGGQAPSSQGLFTPPGLPGGIGATGVGPPASPLLPPPAGFGDDVGAGDGGETGPGVTVEPSPPPQTSSGTGKVKKKDKGPQKNSGAVDDTKEAAEEAREETDEAREDAEEAAEEAREEAEEALEDAEEASEDDEEDD